MAKKKNNSKWGLALVFFVLLTSMLSVFQIINIKKFDVKIVVAMSQSEVYENTISVDDNTTAVIALSSLMNTEMDNDSLSCVQAVCNEGNNSWVAMNEKGVQIDPFTHKMAEGELVYFIYVVNGTVKLTDSSKAQRDMEAINNLLKISQ